MELDIHEKRMSVSENRYRICLGLFYNTMQKVFRGGGKGSVVLRGPENTQPCGNSPNDDFAGCHWGGTQNRSDMQRVCKLKTLQTPTATHQMCCQMAFCFVIKLQYTRYSVYQCLMIIIIVLQNKITRVMQTITQLATNFELINYYRSVHCATKKFIFFYAIADLVQAID